jgi:hypothetical protein
MQIAIPTPVSSLIVDPRADQDVAIYQGLFGALAQGEDWRRKLERLDAAVIASPQTEMPVCHHFSRGVYARELFIPKGTVLTGRIHKYSQINILAMGDISVLTENGIERVQAPTIIVSPPGTKRAGYAHEDTIWITVCGNEGNVSDPDALEDKLTSRTYGQYETWCTGLLEQKEH